MADIYALSKPPSSPLAFFPMDIELRVREAR